MVCDTQRRRLNSCTNFNADDNEVKWIKPAISSEISNVHMFLTAIKAHVEIQSLFSHEKSVLEI